jgi:5-methylcytosine-specific restriction endonuclease McrBC regulatory subunit McrC
MKPISFKLDESKDADIIAFLEDKPKTYLIKTALRLLMEKEKNSGIAAAQPQTEAPKVKPAF